MTVHDQFLSFFTVAWLTPLMTPPATAKYPASFTTNTGSETGAVKMAPPMAATASPIFLIFLKKTGVGFFILLMTVFMFLFFKG